MNALVGLASLAFLVMMAVVFVRELARVMKWGRGEDWRLIDMQPRFLAWLTRSRANDN